MSIRAEMRKIIEHNIKVAKDGGDILPLVHHVDPGETRNSVQLTKSNKAEPLPLTKTEQRAKIQAGSDPLQFLMDIANGLPIETYIVDSVDENDNPVMHLEYVHPTLSQRIKVAEGLTKKILPDLTAQSKQLPGATPDGGDGHVNGTWAQIVAAAASKVAEKLVEEEARMTLEHDFSEGPNKPGRLAKRNGGGVDLNPDPDDVIEDVL